MEKGQFYFAKKHKNSWISPILRVFHYVSETRSDRKKRISDSDSTSKNT